MASKTEIVCLCEGRRGESIDEVFINRLMKSLKPSWIRQKGSNVVRAFSCGGRKEVMEKMPSELRACLGAGCDSTLMVWADCDDDCDDGDALKAKFRLEAERQGITRDQFERVVFVFAKDRLENWIEYLETGATDESKEGPRVKNNRSVTVAEAAKKLAKMCQSGARVDDMPSSLQWSCKNWRALAARMR